jgi:hypothetical protein
VTGTSQGTRRPPRTSSPTRLGWLLQRPNALVRQLAYEISRPAS